MSVPSGGRHKPSRNLTCPQWVILSFSRPAVHPWISSNFSWRLSFPPVEGLKSTSSILMWALYRRKLEDLALKSNRLNALKKDFYRISHLSVLLALRGVNFFITECLQMERESVVHWAAIFECSSHFMLRTVNRTPPQNANAQLIHLLVDKTFNQHPWQSLKLNRLHS